MLDIRNVSKRYGNDVLAVRDVSLTLAQGEVLALLGPSGCGKTTLLRMIAGLEQADTGQILLDGEDLTRIPIHRRNFGFMFQDFALFPHKTVAENIGFGLRMRNDKPRAIQSRVAQMLELVNLPGYEQRTIFELSGGERQRVALARSLAPNPRLLMLDEPLGSLDRNLRENLAQELRNILRDLGLTAIYVTHDQQEALVMSDRLAIMRAGEIQQIAPPEQVYRAPAGEFVARFLGFRNLIPIHGLSSEGMVQTPLGDFPLPSHADAPSTAFPAAPHALLIRPESARIADTAGPSGDSTETARRQILHGTLRSAIFFGVDYRIVVEIEPSEEIPGTGLLGTEKPETELPGQQPYQLHFDVPSHQMDRATGVLVPTPMPAVGQPIALTVFPDLMSVIPLGT